MVKLDTATSPLGAAAPSSYVGLNVTQNCVPSGQPVRQCAAVRNSVELTSVPVQN
jgi:hypothetical protein